MRITRTALALLALAAASVAQAQNASSCAATCIANALGGPSDCVSIGVRAQPRALTSTNGASSSVCSTAC